MVSHKEVRTWVELMECAEGRPGDRKELRGRDGWVGSVLWEEWESGVRDHIDSLMERR